MIDILICIDLCLIVTQSRTKIKIFFLILNILDSECEESDDAMLDTSDSIPHETNIETAFPVSQLFYFIC